MWYTLFLTPDSYGLINILWLFDWFTITLLLILVSWWPDKLLDRVGADIIVANMEVQQIHVHCTCLLQLHDSNDVRIFSNQSNVWRAVLSFPFQTTCTNLSNIRYIHSTNKFGVFIRSIIRIAGIVSCIDVGSALENQSISETNTTSYQWSRRLWVLKR